MSEFRYKTVLKQKRFNRDQLASQLVSLRHQLTDMQTELDQLDAQHQEWMRLMTDASQPGILRLPELLEYRRAISKTAAARKAVKEEIDALSANLAVREQELLVANRSAQTFEKLEAQHQAEQCELEQRQEQRQLDEIAAIRDLAKRAA